MSRIALVSYLNLKNYEQSPNFIIVGNLKKMSVKQITLLGDIDKIFCQMAGSNIFK